MSSLLFRNLELFFRDYWKNTLEGIMLTKYSNILPRSLQRIMTLSSMGRRLNTSTILSCWSATLTDERYAFLDFNVDELSSFCVSITITNNACIFSGLAAILPRNLFFFLLSVFFIIIINMSIRTSLRTPRLI